MLCVVGAVGLTATWGSLAPRGSVEARAFSFPTLVVAFLFAMSLAVLADNLGILWVALEATTITTAFLVGHYRTRTSLEAAWKYVVLGSVGVAIALLGIVLLYAATVEAGQPTLSWTVLAHDGLTLDPGLVKIAAGLTLLGFATKAGLAPMHSWLPDAHSQAPAAVSGLMSGVLLSVAFYGILRIQAITDAVIGPELMRGLLIAGGLLSIAEAGALILRQRDLKRMLAYSSIEHMGIIALAAAIGGPLAISAALLHMLGHGLAKSSTFVVSGRILTVEGDHPDEPYPVAAPTAPGPGRTLPRRHRRAARDAALRPVLHRGRHRHRRVPTRPRLGHGDRHRPAAARIRGHRATRKRHGVRGRRPTRATRTPTPTGKVDRSWHGPALPIALALAAAILIGFLAGPLSALLTDAAATLGGGS